METGTSTSAFVSPSVIQYHPATPKAWAVFDGSAVGTNAPTAGYNVNTIIRASAGVYTVNMGITMSSTNYAVVVNPTALADAGGQNVVLITRDTTAFTLDAENSASAQTDYTIAFSVWGDI